MGEGEAPTTVEMGAPSAEVVAEIEAELDDSGANTPSAEADRGAPAGPSEPNVPGERPRWALDPDSDVAIPKSVRKYVEDRDLEDPSGKAMDAFYARLLDVGRGKEGTLARVAHWGDSTIAADGITATIRRRLQHRFGDGGHGFHLGTRAWGSYRHQDMLHRSSDEWRHQSMLGSARRDGRYGLGGNCSEGTTGQSTTFGSAGADSPIGRAIDRFEIYFGRFPGGGDLTWSIGGKQKGRIATKAREADDGFEVIAVEDAAPPVNLTLRVASGTVRLYGVVMETKGPGVVYDSLGMEGARAARFLNADEDHFQAQVARRAPDLIVMQFGGNELVDIDRATPEYRRTLSEAIDFVRSGRPEAACLLVAPVDQGTRGPKGIRSKRGVEDIVGAQREIAFEHGCAFYDTWKMMGGNGSMGRWVNSPARLGWGDLEHLTPNGTKLVGTMIYRALLRGFLGYLDRTRALAAIAPPPQSAAPASQTATTASAPPPSAATPTHAD